MIYDSKGNSVKSLCIDGHIIKAAYIYLGGVLHRVFGVPYIYYGFSERADSTPTEEGMTKTAGIEFSIITWPESGKPNFNSPEQTTTARYFYMYIPAKYIGGLSYYINGMACTPIESGRKNIDDEEYVCYRFGEKQNWIIKIEGRYE